MCFLLARLPGPVTSSGLTGSGTELSHHGINLIQGSPTETQSNSLLAKGGYSKGGYNNLKVLPGVRVFLKAL
jgi:hypothetical protein